MSHSTDHSGASHGSVKTYMTGFILSIIPVSYTHLRAHETGRNLVCRLLLEKKKRLMLEKQKKKLNDKETERLTGH